MGHRQAEVRIGNASPLAAVGCGLPGTARGDTAAVEQARTTWPSPEVPMQLHLDLTVPDLAELHRQHDRARALGAEILLDRTNEVDEPLYVFADLAGHPFCIFVA